MIGLETQVREALIDQRANELVRCISEYPEYKSRVTELVETMADSIIGSMASAFGDIDEKEMTKMKQEYRKEVLPQIQAQFDNPEQLRKIMYEQARKQYISVKQLKAILRPHFADMREDGEIGEKVIADYEKSYEGLFEFIKTNDRIVRRLAKVAKKDGIDKATQKETRNSVIKKMFPTPDEYRTFAQGGMEAIKSFYQQAQSALTADGEMGQALGGIFGAMGQLMEKAQEMNQKIQGNYLEETIQEIYG